MTLTDSGPLIALVDRHDKYHASCTIALSTVDLPLLTTLPAMTEAMYFLGGRIGWHAQSSLYALYRSSRVEIEPVNRIGILRMEELMAKYADTPMNFADASLVAVAEYRKLRRIFTLDEHFRVYQLYGREPFDMVPASR